jgi:hypothetical protein
MYGTIFNLKIKPGHNVELLKVLKEEQDNPEGMVAWFVMDPDQKDEWIGVAVFESKETHIANAQRPEQHELFLKMMDHLESEPTWTDGTYVISKLA